ncbi:class A beta-lactamase [Veronia pacifica]|uniref:beta-lactamase n=1 Tax=Veronia pacifica TaxID=1080227 RepID=A0A1C3EMT1_9GAMM|nr:class A beta-lactamase [Veronia pacifica]ODA34546.1 hypothetical protein A8L45_06140 [Veronia pacifica]
MKKFILLIGLTLGAVANSVTAAGLSDTIKKVEQQTKGRVGVAVWDSRDNSWWNYRGSERFPMMSTFKTLLCAKALHDIESGSLSSDASERIESKNLIPWSPITEQRVGQSMTVIEACEATMLTSDNTAANLALNLTGGPSALTAFLIKQSDSTTNLTRFEPDLNTAIPGENRDTTSPEAMLRTLQKILLGNALTRKHRAQILMWMKNNRVSDPLLRSVLPAGWQIADRSGAGGYGSRGVTALVWPNSDRKLMVSIYLTETKLDLTKRNKVLAEIGKAVFSNYR